jgi:hypothetical protein
MAVDFTFRVGLNAGLGVLYSRVAGFDLVPHEANAPVHSKRRIPEAASCMQPLTCGYVYWLAPLEAGVDNQQPANQVRNHMHL